MSAMKVAPSKLITKVAFALFAAFGAAAGSWAWGYYQQYRAAQLERQRLAVIQAEKKSPRGIEREAVKHFLNDPASAQFRDDVPAKRVPGVWCGEVNARNRMGGMVGFTRYVAELSDDPDLPEMNDVYFEPTDSVGDQDAADLFAGKWKAFCE